MNSIVKSYHSTNTRVKALEAENERLKKIMAQ